MARSNMQVSILAWVGPDLADDLVGEQPKNKKSNF